MATKKHLGIVLLIALAVALTGMLTRGPTRVDVVYHWNKKTTRADAFSARIPYPLKALIMSLNQTRYKDTSNKLARFGFAPVHVEPVPFDSVAVGVDGGFRDAGNRFKMLEKTHSNKLTHFKMLQMVALDDDLPDNGWAFCFEDDVVVDESVKDQQQMETVLLEAMRAADGDERDPGFMYLGMCLPECNVKLPGTESPMIEMRRCVGRCAHAYGVRKRDAMFAYGNLVAGIRDYSHLPGVRASSDAFRELSDSQSPIAPTIDGMGSQYYYMDCFFDYGFRALSEANILQRPVLVGSHLGGTDNDPRRHVTHWGLVFQDRVTYPTSLAQFDARE